MNNLITIVITTYKRNKTLERAIESAINQSHQNFEIIVVDDNDAESMYRQDNLEFSKKYKVDKRVKFIYLEKNRGANYARNKGVELSKGDLIAFLDDDDTFSREKLLLQYQEFAKDSNLDICYTGINYIVNEKKVNERKIYIDNSEELIAYLADKFLTSTSSIMIKKTAFNEIGKFSEHLKRFQDADLILKLALKKKKFKGIQKNLTNLYEDEVERITNVNSSIKFWKTYQEYLKNNIEEIKKLKREVRKKYYLCITKSEAYLFLAEKKYFDFFKIIIKNKRYFLLDFYKKSKMKINENK